MTKKEKDWRPDWRDPEQYPDHEKTSPKQWAWEFLRRNLGYQALYDEFVQPFFDEKKKYFDEESAWKKVLEKGLLSKSALKNSEDNDINFLPITTVFTKKFDVNFEPFLPPSYETDSPSMDFLFNFEGVKIVRSLDSSHKRSDILVSIDPSKPIRPQLRAVERYCASIKKTKKRNHRNNWDNYAIYLRILDADIDGAPNDKIANILYPNSKNKHPDYEGNRKIRDARKAAERLRDIGYKFMIFNEAEK